jgi:hypothetical protein
MCRGPQTPRQKQAQKQCGRRRASQCLSFNHKVRHETRAVKGFLQGMPALVSGAEPRVRSDAHGWKRPARLRLRSVYSLTGAAGGGRRNNARQDRWGILYIRRSTPAFPLFSGVSRSTTIGFNLKGRGGGKDGRR